MKIDKQLIGSKRLVLWMDNSRWIFPLSLNISCVGNNNRIYTISLDLLCFRLILCIDEDSYS